MMYANGNYLIFQESGRMLFEAIRNGDSHEVKHLMCKKFVGLRDKCGRNVVHVAILYQQTAILRFLARSYPSLLNETDNVSRINYFSLIKRVFISFVFLLPHSKKLSSIKSIETIIEFRYRVKNFLLMELLQKIFLIDYERMILHKNILRL